MCAQLRKMRIMTRLSLILNLASTEHQVSCACPPATPTSSTPTQLISILTTTTSRRQLKAMPQQLQQIRKKE
jgi:hypothetical protein